jgi:acyl-CoA reductase-like NAD-dependent aldehyde dehydrogenase
MGPDDDAVEHAVVIEPIIQRGLLVGGKEIDAADEAQLEIINPATGGLIGRVSAAGEADIDAAVDVAREAFNNGVWSRLPIWERAKTLNRFADVIDEHIEELFRLETLNNGRPIAETRAQVARLSGWYRYNAALLLADRGASIPMPGSYHVYTSRFPIGVVGILSSFNHPLMIGSKSLAPALATGNSVLLKPSELTPLTSLALGDLAHLAGIPPGVLNVVPGLGPVAGKRIAEHPDVGKVTFTGGSAAGRQVATAAAGHFAKVTVELGGKTPVIVFDDIDIETAARGAAFGAFIAAGQTCICGSRLLVQRNVYEEFVTRLVEIARSIRIGDPADADTQLGPVISEQARQRVLSYLSIAQGEGAVLATGGGVPQGAGLDRGYFIEPTVLRDVTNDMRCAREEIFGPITVVIPFDDEDEAVRLANDSPFGLGSAIWTGQVGRAHRVAERLTHGIVWVNDHHRLDPAVPWGGVRDSGSGREGGWESFHDFTHVRSVTIRTDASPVDWYGGETGRLN